MQEGGLDYRMGIACRMEDISTGEETSVVMAPFSRDREAVMELIQRWNREQPPLQQFRDIILPGELWEREEGTERDTVRGKTSQVADRDCDRIESLEGELLVGRYSFVPRTEFTAKSVSIT